MKKVIELPLPTSLSGMLSKSWFLGRGWGQQILSFQSPAVHWMARTSSLNCLSCRNPYQIPHSKNCLPPFTEKNLYFSEKCFVASPFPKISVQIVGGTASAAKFLSGNGTATATPHTQRAPNPPEFAQPRLGRVKGQSSPARGSQIWVCLFLFGRCHLTPA